MTKHPLKILIVDDCPNDRELLRAVLETERHLIREAGDGEEALVLLEQETFDLIISDILMPRMDGYRFCSEVRARGKFSRVPFIFYSSLYRSFHEDATLSNLGADKFVPKPSPSAEIHRIVREVTGGRPIDHPVIPPLRVAGLLADYSRQLVAKLEVQNAELLAQNEALVESEQKLHLKSTALETAANGVVITDLRGTILWVNPAFCKLSGYPSTEVIGKTPRLLKSGLHPRELYQDLWSTILRGETWRGHFTNRRKDGTLYQDEHTITPVRAKDGAITHFVAIMNDVTEQREAETAVRRLAAIVESSGDAIIGKDLNSIVTSWNKGAETIFGYSAGEMVGHSIMRLIPEERKDEEALILSKIGRGENVEHFETVRKTRDGRLIDVSVTVSPIRNAEGRPIGASKVARDITERKQVEDQLLWKTAFFEAQVNSALDGILIVDQEGKKVLQNERMLALWNIPPEIADEPDDSRRLEWVSRQVKNPKLFAEKVTRLYGQPEEVSRDELELVDGRIFDRYSAPVRGRDGRYYGRIWAFRDITEQKKADQRIAEQAAFLDKAQDAIVVRDLSGKILFWNQGAERLYGWTRDEVLGRDIGQLLYTKPARFIEVNSKTIERGEWHGELQHLTRDRKEITIEARWTLIRDNEGQPKSILAINTDITEKKKIEAQFMRAQRMESIGTLAGGIAHDLNNILAPIMMSIDILKTITSAPQAQHILETIETSARRGADIVRQVLSFARGLEGERVEIQLKHLLKDLEKIIRDTFPKDIRLQFTIPGDVWTILGDPTQVHQILLNLCVNARDAMPHGGNLSIVTENVVLDDQYVAMNLQARPGRHVQISVIDSGTGMPAELLDKIFEPFFTTKEINKGTGLGLSTVMAIVKSHGGMINVYSEPGKGTCFKVCLPALETASEAQPDPTPPISLPRGNGETILVVDDEASVLNITSQTLQAFGYRVLTATDGADAVASYAQHKDEIAVVLTDMMMPVMDGPAAIHALLRINPHVKIVAVSGLNANENVVKASGAGVKHFIMKPYTAGALLKTLHAVLEEPA